MLLADGKRWRSQVRVLCRPLPSRNEARVFAPKRPSIAVPRFAFSLPRLVMRRVLVISHTYVQPAHRGKLRALAARGLEVTVGVPQRWREPGLGEQIESTWERQAGLEVFPIPAKADRYGRRALKALLRDKRPDLVQIEEEPASAAALQVIK